MNRSSLDLAGKRQPKGNLTALQIVKRVKNFGVVWKCLCSCGNYRNVLARDFKAHRIKKCEPCVAPDKKLRQRQLCARKREIARDLGDPFYPDEFISSWREKRDKFNRAERFLYEVVLDGRVNWWLELQSVDLVMRTESIALELETFGIKRKRRALVRYLEWRKKHEA